MKHFIYLTEDKIYYIRRSPGRSGGYYFLGFRPVGGLEDLERAMASLAEVYNLKGRRVTLIMGVKGEIHVVKLPSSMKNTALQMAEKQLLALGREEEKLLAADLIPASKEKMPECVVYTVPQNWLSAVRPAALRSGMHLKEILPEPAFVASFPDPKDYGMGESPVILVRLAEDFISLYEIEDGRCFYWKKLGLKPAAFSKMGEERVLMEELQAQIEEICVIRKKDNEDFKPGGVLILNECLKEPKSCARYLGGLLNIPCRALNGEAFWEKQTRAEKLKNLQFGKKGDHGEDEDLWMRIADAGFPVKPVCISLLLFALTAASLLTAQFYTHRKLQRMESMHVEGQDAFEKEKKKQLEEKKKELAELAAQKRKLSGTIVLDPTLFSSIDSALRPKMQLESLEFLAEDGKICIKLLTDDARDIPQFIQAMEENGFLMEQSRWQKQEADVRAEILFKPGKEAGHED